MVRTTSNGATTGHKLNVLIADHLGTANTTVELSSGQPVTRRAFKPYGELRGTKPTSWPNKRSYLGVGIDDATTGLTHIGAREYDQNSGRFLSADPVIDIADPIQMNGYAYSSNSPVSNSDPSGLCADLDCPTRASPNHENRTPTESPSSGEPRYSQNYEAALNSGNVYPAFFIQKNKEIYPGVFVDRSWKYAEQYAQQLWKDAANWCQEEGPTCLTAPAADEVVAQNILNHTKWIACVHLGDESGCASKVRPVGAVAMIAMTGLDGPFGFSGNKASGGCKCFLADTDVLMANGETKDIEDVKLGDEVLATDPETGETGPRKVTRLIRTDGDKYFNELSIATEDGIEKLAATHEHPFWSPSEHDWVPAGKLTPGMTLRTDNGTTVIVTANRAYTKQTRTYNLTIDDLHTYYVLAGETPVLVHNSGEPGFDLSEMDAPGHSNYVLADKNNRVYYVGRFGPNETPASVQRRHAGNHDRFNPANGDRMHVYPGTRTYGQARLLEQRMMDVFGTHVGRGPTYRGNRDNPMDEAKKSRYLAYERYKNGGCP